MLCNYKVYVIDYDKDFNGDKYITYISIVAIFDDYHQAMSYARRNYPDYNFCIVDSDGSVIY